MHIWVINVKEILGGEIATKSGLPLQVYKTEVKAFVQWVQSYLLDLSDFTQTCALFFKVTDWFGLGFSLWSYLTIKSLQNRKKLPEIRLVFSSVLLFIQKVYL